jgi:hypothetical protein
MDFNFDRNRSDAISRQELLKEMERVALQLNREFTLREFKKYAQFGGSCVFRTFGSWNAAKAELREHLKSKNINLTSKPHGNAHSENFLFSELERVWTVLGHRPSTNEWEISGSTIHVETYRRRFGGWEKACLRFIEYKMGGAITDKASAPVTQTISSAISSPQKKSRTIPLALRLKILTRDSFRCVLCGRSPATEHGIVLHLDHIVPHADGGDGSFENLRTLCQECNWGKGKDNA